MRSGGIYDQVGSGFHRYSTDARWQVPHFEKMLYDQALHTLACAEAWQATGAEAWKDTAKEICAYVLRDLALPEGAFATAEDADSEGEEGRFYVWTESEIQSVLGNGAAEFCARYGVSPEGSNILHREISDRAPAGEAEAALLAARAFGEPSFVQAAVTAARFVTLHMRSSDGGLFHRHRDGESAMAGFADDYAFLAWGLFELYEATFDPTWLEECVRLTEHFLEHFWDQESGGFFSTANGEEVTRRKSFTDGVIPSANSVGVLLLLALNRMTGRLDFEEKAEQLLRQYPESAGADAISFSFFLAAADFAAGPPCEVVVVGDPDAPDTQEMLRVLSSGYLPNAVVILKPAGVASDPIARLAPYVSSLRQLNGKATAYVCRNFTCSLPTNDIAVMLAELARA
jgi:uncharacterized protein YyaL (SSP411 family)